MKSGKKNSRAANRSLRHGVMSILRPGKRSSKVEGAERSQVAAGEVAPPVMPREWPYAKRIGLAVLCGVFLWAYGPTWRQLIQTWSREPDYSHGFLVIPLALCFLWVRRERAPRIWPGLAWVGLLLIAVAVLVRVGAAAFYIDAVDAWSMLIWIAGAVWFFGGRRVFVWAGPSLAFLCFMTPLPFRAERLLSHPLQRIATKLSCWTLQSFGQPALAEGNTILLGANQMAVEDACSGLRIFVSILALGFAYVILVRRTWWEKLLLLASTLPIALVANSTRIVVTGMLYQHVSSEAAVKFSHDLAGWIMIPFAAALFGLVLWYLGKLFNPAERMVMKALVRDAKARRAKTAST